MPGSGFGTLVVYVQDTRCPLHSDRHHDSQRTNVFRISTSALHSNVNNIILVHALLSCPSQGTIAGCADSTFEHPVLYSVHTFTNYCFDDDLNQQVLIVLHKMTESSFEGEEEEEKMTEASNSVSVKLYRLGKQNALISSDAEMTADLYLPMTQREYHTSIRRYKFFWRDTSMAIVV